MGEDVLTTMMALDLHRPALPAAHASRLPAHLLRRLSEGMVCFPSIDCHLDPSLYLPVVSRLGAVDAAQCFCHDIVGQLCPIQPAAGEERGREAGGQDQVQAWRQCPAETAPEGRARRGGARV
jgi:hypothetical protein